MRRPDEVVRQDKRKATVLWIALIISIVTYAAYLLFRAKQERENPSTSFELSNVIYRYPDVWVCPYDHYGCDDYALEEQCAASMDSTEGGVTRARYHPGGDEVAVNIKASLTKAKGWCVQFETSALTVRLGKDRDPDDYLNYVLMDLYWHPGGDGDSTTCIAEEGEWENHSESVFMFLHDPEKGEKGNVSTGIQVPYSCITNQSSNYIFTYVDFPRRFGHEGLTQSDRRSVETGIGLTVVNGLGGEATTSYKALSTTSSSYKFKREEVSGVQRPYAYLQIELEQEPDSLQIITEINPLNILELLGNVGGFWDLILILWPLFFVAAIPSGASLKMRDFKDIVRSADSVKAKIATRLSVGKKVSPCEADEQLPHWEGTGAYMAESKAERNPHGVAHQSITNHRCQVLIRLFDDHGLVAVINGCPVKKFLKLSLKAICLKAGAEIPGLQKILPANTYLITVPLESTTIAIAKVVMDRCAAGGDAAGESDPEPIPFKVKRVQLSVLQSYALSSSPYVELSDSIACESDVVMDQWRSVRRESPTGNQPLPVLFLAPSKRPYADGKTQAPSTSPPV